MGLIWRLLFENVLIAADVTHAKNFINIDGDFWELPPSEKQSK
nr:MAG TPA: hypothetical protein [Caudoviricetes sp.]DAU40166.1 MAG TPA: hypothetical protein [Caudoviricetes sp.]